jgi:hypothetical protein
MKSTSLFAILILAAVTSMPARAFAPPPAPTLTPTVVSEQLIQSEYVAEEYEFVIPMGASYFAGEAFALGLSAQIIEEYGDNTGSRNWIFIVQNNYEVEGFGMTGSSAQFFAGMEAGFNLAVADLDAQL